MPIPNFLDGELPDKIVSVIPNDEVVFHGVYVLSIIDGVLIQPSKANSAQLVEEARAIAPAHSVCSRSD
jgi:hypothetical protein